MTIITTTAPVSILAPNRAPRHRPATPNYVARRLVVGALTLAVMVAAVVLLAATLAGFGGVPAVASEASPASSSAAMYVARPGDTLWSIAREYRGDVDQRRYVDALIDLNGGTSIAAGQAVRLP